MRRRSWISLATVALAASVLSAEGSVIHRLQGSQPARWILVYVGGPNRPAYSANDFRDLLTVVDTEGRHTSWLFSGVIFSELYARSRRTFTPAFPDPPATGADWSEYLDSLLSPNGAIARLDTAVSKATLAIGPLRERLPVVVTIPFPFHLPRLDTLRFAGTLFHLGDDVARAALASAYMDDVVNRFRNGRYSHVRLDGFYWLRESVEADDSTLIPLVADRTHRLGLRLLWIPFYSAPGAPSWRKYGFDEAWLQPNYFYQLSQPAIRLDSAVARARAWGLGIEVEFDHRLFKVPDYYDRLEPYLMALETAPDLRARSIAMYDGDGALIDLGRRRDLWHRALYRRLVEDLGVPDSASGGKP